MKQATICIILFACLSLASAQDNNVIPFDFDWKFRLGDVPGASKADFDDTSWRLLDVPHDWSIEGAYHPTANKTDWQSGYLPAGTGWYRKSFDYDKRWDGKKISILFDGVYMNSTVWINGRFLGNRPNGYVGFEYDLTPYLKAGKNSIAVQVDHSKPLSARWYTGSGIYRHVWLKVNNQVHIPTWGVYFAARHVTDTRATAEIKTTVQNAGDTTHDLILESILKTNDGKIVSSARSVVAIERNKQTEIGQSLNIANPEMWSPASPYLYTLESVLRQGGKLLHSQQMRVGVRNAEYSVKGFFLNGKPVKIKGVCDHHTAGALGAAIPDQSLERKLKILKKMGCNAVRTAHNPFSPEFYTICDSLGLIVMDELFDGWEKPKAAHDYGNYFNAWWEKDLTDFVRRDRNHPCILFWSIGNEVNKPTPETQEKLVSRIRRLDPTRPITQGGTDPTRGMHADYNKNYKFLDLVGFNGNGEEVGEFEKFEKNSPHLFGIGTEVPHTYQTRGVYRTKTAWRRRDFPAPWEQKSPIKWEDFKQRVFPIEDLTEEEVFPEEAANTYYQSSYDNASVRISAQHSWKRSSSFPWLFGEFRWGSFDYLGEAEWPQRCGNFGIIDLCGFPKDHYYLYQSMWSDQPMVHLLPHWTHPGKEGVEIPVVAYTNCHSVELFRNGESLGEKKYAGEQLVWHVPYAAGEITAVAKTKDGKTVTTTTKTAGQASRIRIKADKKTAKANRTDVIHFEIDITDATGTLCPMAAHEIFFEITGPGKLIAVDNGDPVDLSSNKIANRKAFRGKAFLIVQTTDKKGEIKVKALSEGLKEGSYTITVHAN